MFALEKLIVCTDFCNNSPFDRSAWSNDSELNSCTVHDYLADYDTTNEVKTNEHVHHKYPVTEFSFN